MVEVTSLNNEMVIINSNLIEKIEFIPETKITLTTGRYYLIKESKQEIVDMIINYNRKIFIGLTTE
ncbi:flagellar protein FlbD [Sedimentibacter acidaminivorans]|uniref:Flagellar protein FlbD n=1 Tax=Sedimentibacter acidaminivorans TaxID=913099 RepID=A0ABS4GDI0_9FIRM|nr:flagellar FlbD family protein [Sedimentibacter acidaminivorans]MBP1925746.1 flagellar protein FlbD [Sedimentibacter acidaminivorans]